MDMGFDPSMVKKSSVPSLRALAHFALATKLLCDTAQVEPKASPASADDEPSISHPFERKAYPLFLKSHHEGLPIGTAVCGLYAEFGLGGQEIDMKEAERLYVLAANRGSGLAQARLTFLKTHGRPGIKINLSEAEHWGAECKKHGESAVQWLKQAASSNIAAAQFCLALCYYNGIAVKSDDSKAFKWCEAAGVLGHPGAQNVLGNLYIEGSGCTANPNLGLRWYIKAAEKKEAAAIYNIGTLFERGLAVEQDINQAFEWYVRAAVFGSVNAQNVLGIFHEQGLGVPRHSTRAAQYYRTAALNGHPHAQYNLGRCYHEGIGVTADNSMAVTWFRMGAEQRHTLSMLSLAICYERGIGVKPNRQRAMDYYVRALKKGSLEARKRLVPIVAGRFLAAARVLLNASPDAVTYAAAAAAAAYAAALAACGPSSYPPTFPTLMSFGMSMIEDNGRIGGGYGGGGNGGGGATLRHFPTSPISPQRRFNNAFSSALSFSELLASASGSSSLSYASFAAASTYRSSSTSSSSIFARSVPKKKLQITDLPTEIILHILSFVDEDDILEGTLKNELLAVASERFVYKDLNQFISFNFECSTCGDDKCSKLRHLKDCLVDEDDTTDSNEDGVTDD